MKKYRFNSGLAARRSLFFLLILLAAGCTARPYDFSRPDAELCEDLKYLPQDLNAYTGDPQLAAAPLLSPAAQASEAELLRENLFHPWLAGSKQVPRAEALWGMGLNPKRGYAENLRPYPPERWNRLKENCDSANYPSVALRAVTVRTADLRLMPTPLPYFYDPAKVGQGYPFDYLQNSSLPPGSPVLVVHFSKDRQWALVESANAMGWVEIDRLAEVDEKFVRFWIGQPLAAITAEAVLLLPETEKTSGRPGLAQLPRPGVVAGIGTLLPLAAGGNASSLRVYFPERGPDGLARLRIGRLERWLPPADRAAPGNAAGNAAGQSDSQPGQAAPWPLPINRANLADLGNRIMAQPYGWGGYGGNRDCSALTRDLFLPFGLWLPRNSASQSNVGQKTELAELAPKAKEKAILEQGQPFLTLIGMPGHIALYLGEYQGRAVMFHSMWRIRAQKLVLFGPNPDHSQIVGKAVVTTTTPGSERKEAGSSLLGRMQSINYIPQAAEPAPEFAPELAE